MANRETLQLLDNLIASQRELFDKAASLTVEQLDAPVQLRNREAPLRNILYMVGTHAREHTVHLQKLLAATGAPGGQPTEAQLILAQAGEALGGFLGLFARISDADLDQELEAQTPRKVLEHMASSYAYYLRNIKSVAGD